MATMLHRVEKSSYTDQHGFEHLCYRVVEQVEVSMTGEFYEYPYYHETIRNPIWESEDGRVWRKMVATDYGGRPSWNRMEDGQRVDERWVPLAGAKTIGTVPVIYC